MGTTTDKLQNIINSKNAISAAIEAKGGTVPTELSGYGPAIESLPNIAMEIVNRSATKITAADLSGATYFGNYAIQNCYQLTSFTFPDTVLSTGNYVFQGCSSLPSIVIPNNVKNLGNNFFDGCTSLTSITLGSSLSSIGLQAFNKCSNLPDITIPNSVTTIYRQAFYNCYSLTAVTFSGKTKAEVQAMVNYPWNIIGSAVIHCSDGDITR